MINYFFRTKKERMEEPVKRFEPCLSSKTVIENVEYLETTQKEYYSIFL